MKIQIDTKQDSHDEIRKVIKLLMGIVGGHTVYSNEEPKPEHQPNVFESPSPAVPNLMSMFDSAPSTTAAPAPEEKKEDIPQVEFY